MEDVCQTPIELPRTSDDSAAFLHFIHHNGMATPTSYIVIAILSLTLL